MIDACNLALTFITQIIQSITPDSPMMFIFGLAIVVAIFNLIMDFTSLKKGG